MSKIKNFIITIIFLLIFLLIENVKSEAKSSDLYLENLKFNSIIEENAD